MMMISSVQPFFNTTCMKYDIANAIDPCNMLFAKAPSVLEPTKKSANTALLVVSYTALPEPCSKYKITSHQPQPLVQSGSFRHGTVTRRDTGTAMKLSPPMAMTMPLPETPPSLP